MLEPLLEGGGLFELAAVPDFCFQYQGSIAVVVVFWPHDKIELIPCTRIDKLISAHAPHIGCPSHGSCTVGCDVQVMIHSPAVALKTTWCFNEQQVQHGTHMPHDRSDTDARGMISTSVYRK